MKTAMQDLIDEMDIIKGQLWEEGLKDKSAMISDMIKKAVNKLEKEKEQIVKDWQKGYSTGCVVGSNDYTNEDEEKDNGNYYYNQTYNN